MPGVCAVVLNYDGRHHLEKLLPSLARQTHPDLHVIVVDNGSRDDSVRWLHASWPQVEVIALAENVGVTPALNVCLRAGREELLLLLNNDIVLDPRCVAELVAALQLHHSCAAAAPKLLDLARTDVIDGAGDTYSWTGRANRRGHGTLDRGQFDEPAEVFGACGGAALYRRSAIEQVGPFDERFFAMYEDVDWSFRAQLQGWSCWYTPTAVAYHAGSATVGALSEFSLYHNWRNALWVIAKNYPARALVSRAPQLILGQLLTLAIALRRGWTRILLRAWRDALKGLSAALEDRRRVQRDRVRTVSELDAVID
ncbi:MAG: glycosyltransferase family 2 protein [Solirubrobacterales bacterium]